MNPNVPTHQFGQVGIVGRHESRHCAEVQRGDQREMWNMSSFCLVEPKTMDGASDDGNVAEVGDKWLISGRIAKDSEASSAPTT